MANALLGKWYWDGSLTCGYIFGEDGKGAYFFGGGERAFLYRDDGDAVYIYYPGETASSRYGYTIDGSVLQIEDSLKKIVCYKKRGETDAVSSH